ncbi:hypothetical protein RHGRI_027759 [Rhododendron griersonianum]|uniref:Secreted protein n=1 Tax=Rhododendron griersonianum TaxID=479676 RepID=A0AAV6IY14_9ERIC|nr:hypothetical protein RHGRI_027759 [Rhododendron griersonianum]
MASPLDLLAFFRLFFPALINFVLSMPAASYSFSFCLLPAFLALTSAVATSSSDPMCSSSPSLTKSLPSFEGCCFTSSCKHLLIEFRGQFGGTSTCFTSSKDSRLPINEDSLLFSSILNSFPSSETIFASDGSSRFLVAGIV